MTFLISFRLHVENGKVLRSFMVEAYSLISIRWRKIFSFLFGSFFTQTFKEDNQVVFALQQGRKKIDFSYGFDTSSTSFFEGSWPGHWRTSFFGFQCSCIFLISKRMLRDLALSAWICNRLLFAYPSVLVLSGPEELLELKRLGQHCTAFSERLLKIRQEWRIISEIKNEKNARVRYGSGREMLGPGSGR